MDTKKLTGILLMVFVFGLPVAFALYESTSTIVHFNLPTDMSYTLTLPGLGAVTSNTSATPGGTATADVDFNCSAVGSCAAVNPKAHGGSVQADGTPIFEFDNTGNIGINITVFFNDTTPTCIVVWGNTTWNDDETALATANNVIGGTNVTVISNFQPVTAAQDWYMWANFSGCTIDDDVDRLLITTGYT